MLKNRLFIILLPLLIFFTATVVGWTSSTPAVFAANAGTIDKELKDLDTDMYPKNDNGTPQILEFVEYGFAENVFDRKDYALYLYVYNPTCKALSTKEDANTVSIAIEYGTDNEPVRYANIPLTYIDKTNGDNNNLFYKFRVSDVSRLNKTSGTRRYDIAGVQLRYMGEAYSKDYTVGGTWTFTGYGKETTCKKTDLETVRLNVHSTYYRPEGTSDGYTKQDTLYSVYFSVPNYFIKTYGELYAITAEWLYARLNPVLVVNDAQINTELRSKYMGKTVVRGGEYDLGFATDLKYNGPLNSSSDWFMWFANVMYNCPKDVPYREDLNRYDSQSGSIADAGFIFYEYINALYFSFCSPDLNNFTVKSEDIRDYMLEYSKGKADKLLDRYAAELFEYHDERKTVKNIKATDTFSLTSTHIGSSWWQQLWGLTVTDTYKDIEAIHTVKPSDFRASATDTCKALYISESDYDDFYTAYRNSENADSTLMLFRFATDGNYTSQCATVFRHADNADGFSEVTKDAYLAQGVATYLDFDIIDLTFRRAGVYKTIPVVSNPTDIIPEITPPPGEEFGCQGLPTWLIIVIAVVCAILFLPVIVALLPYIIKLIVWLLKWLFKAVIWIITAPFKFVAWLVRKIKSRELKEK